MVTVMRVEIHHVHRYELSPPVRDQMLDIQRELKMISAQVQAVLDKARANNNLVTAIHQRQQAMAQQISDLQAQIAALPVGQVLSDEDKAGLVETANDLDTSNSTLTTDTTANTPQASAGAAAAGSPPPDATSPPAGQPPSSDPSSPAAPPPSTDPAADASQHQADSDAASQAKPLAGTGSAS